MLSRCQAAVALLQSRVVTRQFTSLSVSEFNYCVDPMEGKSYSGCLSVTGSFHHHVFQMSHTAACQTVCLRVYIQHLASCLSAEGTWYCCEDGCTCVCVFKVLLNSLEYMPRNRVLDDKIIIFPICGGITILISYCSPPWLQYVRFQFLQILANTCCLLLSHSHLMISP